MHAILLNLFWLTSTLGLTLGQRKIIVFQVEKKLKKRLQVGLRFVIINFYFFYHEITCFIYNSKFKKTKSENCK